MTEMEYLLDQYEKKFHDVPPPIDAELTDDQMCNFLRECLRSKDNPRNMSEWDFLDLQYKVKFPDDEGIPLMMVPMTEDEWKLTMRKCLRSGKPYELPEDVVKLVEEGVDF